MKRLLLIMTNKMKKMMKMMAKNMRKKKILKRSVNTGKEGEEKGKFMRQI